MTGFKPQISSTEAQPIPTNNRLYIQKYFNKDILVYA